MAYKFPLQEVIYISPVINFKTTGLTTIFTTRANERFVVAGVTMVCASSTAANGDSTFNLGFTAAAYDDIFSNSAFLLTLPNTSFVVSYSEVPMVPANTPLRVNVTGGDTGTAITGYIVIRGFTINT